MRSAAPKNYQVFARLTPLDAWSYVDTYQGAGIVVQAQNLIMARGMQCKVTPVNAAPAQADVFARYVGATKLSLAGMLAESAKLEPSNG